MGLYAGIVITFNKRAVMFSHGLGGGMVNYCEFGGCVCFFAVVCGGTLVEGCGFVGPVWCSFIFFNLVVIVWRNGLV